MGGVAGRGGGGQWPQRYTGRPPRLPVASFGRLVRWTPPFCCHVSGLVNDLTICGDVESNPGPHRTAAGSNRLQAERVTRWDLQSVADKVQYP